MFKARVLLSGIALVGATAAYAGVTVTPAVVSDYDFRGISQSATDPAFQVGVDYSNGPLHVGAWGSNIEWGPSYKGNVELDLVADFTLGGDGPLKANFGVINYTYPEMTVQNTMETWGMLSWNWLSVKASFSPDWFTLGNAWYTEGNASIPIGKTPFSIALHAGYSSGSAWDHIEYTDWSVTGNATFHNFAIGLKYVSSDAPELTDSQAVAAYGKKNVFDTSDRVILSVSTTLPWAK
jgi:uncharacterized protein (TIGR02001 family)